MLPTKIQFIWPSGFRGEDLKKLANQKQELPMVAMFVHLSWVGFKLTTLVVIGTNWISSYKSNYHTIKTTTAPAIGVLIYLS